jgi:hypothetical protein
VALCLVVANLLVLASLSCARKSDPGAGGAAPPAYTPEPEYLREERSSSFGRMESFTLSADAFDRKRVALSRQELKRIVLSKDFGTQVYHVEGSEDPSQVLLQPKILLESSLTGDRTAVREGGSNEMVLDLAVALVDGLRAEVATGNGARKIPENFLIKTPSEFLAELTAALGRKPTFLASVPCPDRVVLRAKGVGEFPVRVQTKLKSCPLNTFFPAQIMLKRSDWEPLALSFLEAGAIEVATDINLSTPLTVTYATLQLTRAALVSAITRLTGSASTPSSAAELAPILDGLVSAIQKAFEIEFPSEAFTDFKDQLVREYFAVAHATDCPKNTQTCFSWTGKPPVGSLPTIEVKVRREDFFGRPLKFQSVSLVSDTLSYHQSFLIQGRAENVLIPPQSAMESPLGLTIRPGEVVEFRVDHLNVGAVAFSAPQILPISHLACVDPYQLCHEGRWRCTNPNTENYNCRPECTVGWDEQCGHWDAPPFDMDRCADICSRRGGFSKWCYPAGGHHCAICSNVQKVCRGFTQVCDQRRVCDRLAAPNLPQLPYRVDHVSPSAPDFAWDCIRLSQGNCDPDKWEDHWERVMTWSLPSLTQTFESHEIAAEDWKQILPGMNVRFSWAESSGMKQLTCAISELEYHVLPPNRLLVVFKNGEKCSPFNLQNALPGYEPALSLLNQIAFPSEFQCGRLWENWEGKRKYTCQLSDGTSTEKESTRAADEQALARGERLGLYHAYYPRVEVQGTLRIVGSYFESQGDLR